MPASMANSLMRTLFLLPLLFHVSFAFFNPFDPFGFFGGDPSMDGPPSFGDVGGGDDNPYIAPPVDNPPEDDNTGGGAIDAKGPEIVTNFKGSWEIASENAGVSAMHLQLLPTNKAIMFDSTVFGPSQIPLPGATDCRLVPGFVNIMDCWAHAVEYDIETAAVRPLKILTDTWCSSGALDVDGNFVQVGGWNDGGRVVRRLQICDTCDWVEYPNALTGERWYATQTILPDGGFIIIGGRRMFNFEFVPPPGQVNKANIDLPFLKETTDLAENNLYPFVNLLPNGNLFVLANNRAIILNPTTKTVVKELPMLEGGARNYPGSGMSALLPIDLNNKKIKPEVLVCGGGQPNAFDAADKQKVFLPALQTCGRINPLAKKPKWNIENMPAARVMGDMLILPNAEILMLNGAKRGAAGWLFADDPNFVPVLYRPTKSRKERLVELQPTTIARMYHSTSAVLPDGKILVAGSNTNDKYNFTGTKYATELRVEKFSPPYLDPKIAMFRPEIQTDFANQKLAYGQSLNIAIRVNSLATKEDLKITMYAPPFTTHGYSMSQRLLILETQQVAPGGKSITVNTPPTPQLAPPGYYLLFAVYKGVPSKGVWVKIG